MRPALAGAAGIQVAKMKNSARTAVQGRFKRRMNGCSPVRVRRRYWGKPRGLGCPRSFLNPPCPPTRCMRIWFATAPLPDYRWAANDEPLVALKL